MTETLCRILAAAVLAPILLGGAPTGRPRPGARDLGAPFDGTPPLPHQLERLARRVSPGLARTGAPRDRLRDGLRKYNRLVNPAS